MLSVLLLASLFFLFKNNIYAQAQSSSKPSYETLEEYRKRQSAEIAPVTDPSVCKNNPEGYIYFQVGEEVFRYTKNSPIRIDNGVVASKLKPQETDIISGCEGNPYPQDAISLIYQYQDGKNPISKIKFYHFKLQGVPLKE